MMTRLRHAAFCASLLAGCGQGAGDAGPQKEPECTESLAEASCARLAEVIQPVALPDSRGNAHADSFDAAILGFRIFFDARFSANQKVRCESCHSVDFDFADNQPVSVAGLGRGVRNSPTMFNAARHREVFWDGRVDTLWAQPLIALEHPDEMGITRLEIVRLLAALYPREYEKAFGTIADFSDTARFPEKGKPGDPAFDSMAEADRIEVDRTVANLGKAFEAYMRKVATGPSLVDRYLAERFGKEPGYGPRKGTGAVGSPTTGETGELLTAEQARGLLVFNNAGCPSCHSGNQLTDDAFHNLGVPARPGEAPDEGRTEAVLRPHQDSPFRVAGPFFDGSPPALSAAPAVLGGFRTPSLRNLKGSAPYGHNGVFATLEEAVDFHLQGGGKDTSTFVGTVDPALQAHDLSVEDRAALIEFLKALEGEHPGLPWGQWPNGNG